MSAFATTASAELNDDSAHNAKYKCTLVIDKQTNDTTYAKWGVNYKKGKTFKYALGKGEACVQGKQGAVKGYYYKDKYEHYGNVVAIYNNFVKYSGEKTYLPSLGLKINGKKVDGFILTAYITDSAAKITGKKMHVVYTQSLRSKPAVSSKKLKKVYQDKSVVKVKKVSGSWAYVYSYSTKSYGWMPRKYLISSFTANRIVEKTVKPKIDYIESGELPIGTKKLISKGTPSKYTYIYKDKYSSGKLISSKLYKKYLDKKGKDTLYELGA
ncbi:hypothetical protein QN089_04780 [Kurthia sp. YJT4]|uniref:hypothetical protein n=1 Tax=Kurthia sp. YJT4 TaxID=3049086 RepID=UPI00254AB5B3|nr:hypothetical protein [Kurthia sp. YJT4]WIL39583.1 hypothetical protein QN089_04780 [Kurthia sp. YJT4]